MLEQLPRGTSVFVDANIFLYTLSFRERTCAKKEPFPLFETGKGWITMR
jgi:hypothetical protein